MAQDIRKMLQEDDHLSSEKLEKGHEKRFEARLEKAFPQEKKGKENKWLYLQIAAVLVVILSVGFVFLNPGSNIIEEEPQVVETPVTEDTVEENPVQEEIKKQEEVPVTKEYRLSDVSPEYKKVEDFYLASLNIELAKLEVNDENRELVRSFMSQMSELDKEYQRLNNEIKETGLTESNIQAMINNLQLRLELLSKLKNKINDINKSKLKSYENQQI